jgi:hypothetical protein
MLTRAVKQLSDNNDVGTILGASSSDVIGFYGLTAGVPQRSNQNQIAVSAASAGGTLFAINSVTLTPSVVTASTATAQVLTLTGSPNLSSDYVIVNKVTATAGLGIGNARAGVTAATVVVNYTNPTASTVTPTVAENYLVAGIRGLTQTVVLSPASVPANSTVEQVFTGIAGLAVGNLVSVTKPTDQAGLAILGARITANQTLAINFSNDTLTAIQPTAQESYAYVTFPGLSVNSNLVVLGANVGVAPTTVISTVSTYGLTVTNGVLADDVIVGFNKPTVQNGVAIAQINVSAANVLAISTLGMLTAVTPTANEVYKVTMYRNAPVAPLTVYSVTITPAAVAPLTTAEQGFTVTGLVASQLVLVNLGAAQSGIGIAGNRVSAANVLGITFSNTSSATIIPPSQTVLVGEFQLFPSTGSYLAQQVLPSINANANLLSEIRLSLNTVNLIGGV